LVVCEDNVFKKVCFFTAAGARVFFYSYPTAVTITSDRAAVHKWIAVLRLARESFTHVKMSPLPVKGYNI
jgi:hypothetical protein